MWKDLKQGQSLDNRNECNEVISIRHDNPPLDT